MKNFSPVAAVEPLEPAPTVTNEKGIRLLEAEPRWKRFVYGILALAIACGFFFLSGSYLVPDHPGTDQNGYMVGGRMLAQTLTMRLSPMRPGTKGEFDPHQFVGRMWVGADENTPDERYYPKYPIGLPAIYAVMLWIGSLRGGDAGVIMSYWISPIGMSLAVFGTYLLGRRFAGSFGGLMASILFASSPVTLQLAVNPNSHAACVGFVVWGMYLLICWWEKRGIWRGLLAGFLLGYAMTIRYSEATLALPLGLVACYPLLDHLASGLHRVRLILLADLLRVQAASTFGDRIERLCLQIVLALLIPIQGVTRAFAEPSTAQAGPNLPGAPSLWRKLVESFSLIIGWGIPVGLLWLYNHYAIGANTGYGPTNESTGFAWKYAADNWETMLRQLNGNGLAMIFPLALAGMGWMFWWNWRAASVMAAWILPCIGIYTFYYWAPDNNNPASYLRFFTTILPGLSICFFWLMSRLSVWAMQHDHPISYRALKWTGVVIVGLVATAAAGYGLGQSWLTEHTPASIGLKNDGKLVRWMTPTPPGDPTVGSRRDAIADLKSAAFGALAVGIAATLLAIAATRGRATLPTVGAGLLAGMIIPLHLSSSIAWLDVDQYNRYQLKFKVDAIRAVVPEGAVVFCNDANILNAIQFYGDYALYDGQTFRRDYVQTLPGADPNDPQGLDPHRRDGLYQRLKQFDQPALDEQVRKIINGAINANRRVFYVVANRPPDGLPKPLKKLLSVTSPTKPVKAPDPFGRAITPDRFDTEVQAYWPGYIPHLFSSPNGYPRGVRMDRPVEPQPNKLPLEVVEVTRHVVPIAPTPVKK